MVPWTHISQPQNGIMIGSAVFAQLNRVSNTQIHRHATSVEIGRIYAQRTADDA